jgi:hypothetical protein
MVQSQAGDCTLQREAHCWRPLVTGQLRLFEAVKALERSAPLRPQTDISTIKPALWGRHSLHKNASKTSCLLGLMQATARSAGLITPRTEEGLSFSIVKKR